mmetsp:Transcript_23967/g.35925  ORF Transcript_23967/g.35925 Transcript_23967/m.35925 type:complete len:484 (-) Transcript_23967:167-1618(-)
MHKCWAGDDQPVFVLAQKKKIRVGLAAGGRFANTECARWFDEKTGKAMNPIIVARCHVRNTKHHARMAKIANSTANLNISIQKLLMEAEEYVGKRMNHKLSSLEKKVHFKIASRQWGYVSTLEDTGVALIRGGKTGLEGYEDMDHIGRNDHVMTVSARMQQELLRSQNPNIHPCSKSIGEGCDRLVVDGYHPFIIDHLKPGLDIKLNKSVCRVEVKDPKEGNANLGDSDYWTSNPANITRAKSIHVTYRDGSLYRCQYVICTVPLGVLQSKSEYSKIEWIPKLSSMKRECIDNMGMGTHNKVVMRFKPNDVFWDADTPQLLSPDPRFHFLNLHAYGKIGMMLCHAWPPYSDTWATKTDKQVLGDALNVLRGMFRKNAAAKKFPKPCETVVTRWNTDPFSMGSYSYMPPGAGWDHLQVLALPHPEVGEPRVFFAGEAMSVKGYQCVDGAYESGERAGLGLLKCYGIEVKTSKSKRKKKKKGGKK